MRSVVAKSDKNLMSAGNVAVCLGPTLLRPERETVASIMELKFCNVLVETLLDNYERIFLSPPPPPPLPTSASGAPAATPSHTPNGHVRSE